MSEQLTVSQIAAGTERSPLRGLLWLFAGPRIAGAAVQVLVLSAAGAVLSLGVQVLLARSLGPAAFGIYLVALAAMNVAVLPAKTEMDSAALRYVAAYRDREEWGLLRGFIRTSRRWVLTLSASVAALGLLITLLLPQVHSELAPEMGGALLLASVLLFPTALLITDSAILQALGWYTKAQLPQQLLRPLLFAFCLLLLPRAISGPLTAATALLANLAASCLALLAAEVWLRGALPAELRYSSPSYATAEWRSTGVAFLSVALAQLAMSPSIDLLLAGALRGPSASGLYGAAVQVAGLVDFGCNAVFFVTAPAISAAFASGSGIRLQQLLRSINRTNALLSLPLAAAALVMGGILLRLYGRAFLLVFPVLVILVVTQVVSALVGATAGYVMTMTEHQRAAAKILALAALGSVLVRFFLTAHFGIVGTASGALATAVVRSLVLALYIRRQMGVNVLAL